MLTASISENGRKVDISLTKLGDATFCALYMIYLSVFGIDYRMGASHKFQNKWFIATQKHFGRRKKVTIFFLVDCESNEFIWKLIPAVVVVPRPRTQNPFGSKGKTQNKHATKAAVFNGACIFGK